MTDELDDDHPLWLINEQLKGLLEGVGAGEDHEAVLAFLAGTGLPLGTVTRIHKALVHAETRWQVVNTANNLVFNMNEDKDGGYFLCEEASDELFNLQTAREKLK